MTATRDAALLGALNAFATHCSSVSGITGKVEGRQDMPTDREATRTQKSQSGLVYRAGGGWCLKSPTAGHEALTGKDLRWHRTACPIGTEKSADTESTHTHTLKTRFSTIFNTER